MKSGNVSEFIDKLFCGEELFFEYCGKVYFLQGWVENGVSYMTLDEFDQPFNGYLWESAKPTMRECVKEFLDMKIWDGKTFEQVEREMTWRD